MTLVSSPGLPDPPTAIGVPHYPHPATTQATGRAQVSHCCRAPSRPLSPARVPRCDCPLCPQAAAGRGQEVPQGVRHGASGDVVHGVPLEEGVPALPRLTEPRRSLLLAHFALEVPSRPPGRAPGLRERPPESFMHTHSPPATELVPPALFSL